MKRRNKEVSIFNLSMLDVMTGALGAVMIIMIVLLTQKIGAEEEESPVKLSKNAEVLTERADKLTEKALKTKNKELTKKAIELTDEAKKLTKKANSLAEEAVKLDKKKEDIDKKEKDLVKREKELEAEAKRVEALTKMLDNIELPKKTNKDDKEEIAFKIPKKVVLVIDLSGSMKAANNEDKEDRISQVKAALKMFIAGMDKEYSIDLVYFPAFPQNISTKCKKTFKITPALSKKCKNYDTRDEAYDEKGSTCYKYGYLDGDLRNILKEEDKYHFYKTLACLQAYHATPTKEAMEYVLKAEKYKDAEGVILFSDGEPDVLTNKQMSKKQLLSHLKKVNKYNKKIFTIGVGSDFRNQKNTTAVNFLRELAKENQGFYIGF